MRILHAVHNYPPEFRGGVERVVEALAAAQAARAHDVAVLAGSEQSGAAAAIVDETHAGVPVFRLVRGPGHRDPIDPLRADLAPRIESVLDAWRPDVLHVHHWLNLGSDLVRRAARRGVPAVVTLHDFASTCALLFRMPDGRTPCGLPQTPDTCGPCIGGRYGVDEDEVRFRVAMRARGFAAELRCAAAISAPSEAHARVLCAYLPEGLAVRACPPGSPPLAAAAASPRTGPLRVLHFGNLCRVKGVEFLARAARAAEAAGANLRLALAGPIVEPGLDYGSATLAGPYDADRLRALAGDADVAAFPSFARETYSLVVDEALRLGLPVLVSDRGAAAERVMGRGLVLPAGDEAAWADALVRLARDPGECARLRAAPHAPLATPDDHAEAMLKLYASARVPAGAPVDIEGPLLDRLAHFERRLGDFITALSRKGSGEA